MYALLSLISTVIEIYIWILVGSAVLSWLVAFNVVNTRNPAVAMVTDVLYRLTEPVLAPIRRILPEFRRARHLAGRADPPPHLHPPAALRALSSAC